MVRGSTWKDDRAGTRESGAGARPQVFRRRLAAEAVVILAVASASIGLNTRLDDPPRYDGAGYATLAKALAAGRGYREVNHPDAPAHAHYPPGYPLALAAVWRVAGRVATASAHGLSVGCSIVGVLAFSLWFRTLYRSRVAFLLGLALATNWAWGRVGGSIQSEPAYFALSGLAVLAAARLGRGGGIVAALVVGGLLASSILTRHVGACLAVAVLVDLWIQGRRATAIGAGAVVVAACVPWVAWQAGVGGGTQAELLLGVDRVALAGRQVVFYGRRIPDQILGPVVEVATVFARSNRIAAAATGLAALASSVVLVGWYRAAWSPRRRLAALVPAATFPLLLVWPFTEAGRFLLPLVPFLLIGAVEGLARLLVGLGFARAKRARMWAATLVLLASLPYAVYAIATGRVDAQRRTHAGFEAACARIGAEVGHAGPVLARHAADVTWLTGRLAIGIPAGDDRAIARVVDRHRVAFVLDDEGRYADAPPSPLGRFIEASPGRLRLVWGKPGSAAVYEVQPPAPSIP